MSQYDFIREIAKFGLENDQDKLMSALNDLIEYSKKTKKVNFALQLQSLLKDSKHSQSNLTKIGSDNYFHRLEDRELNDLILEKLSSKYSFENIVLQKTVQEELQHFVKEHRASDLLHKYGLPISNKVLLHGPSGCGKTLASYVIAGELKKMMIVVNLGAIVSSRLGETSKNLAKIFKKAISEECIIFIDEFDSIGKVRDYNQDHGEMKRVVNTILQLFDYLPQTSLIIAATNQKNMLDEALVRRFDLNIEFQLPNLGQIRELVQLVLKNSYFKFDNITVAEAIIKNARGLSYYSIQKTLITAIKRSIFDSADKVIPIQKVINTSIWQELILGEKKSMQKS